MNPKFKCTECDRLTEKFIATIEGPEGTFDEIIHYCHFCDLGFYILSKSQVELVEIEKPKGMFNVTLSSKSIAISVSETME
jgi:hypothetical protein